MKGNQMTLNNIKLIELAVENFKSFAGRTVLSDFAKFNCLVGPNGCGKSNFMDAVSFVLGEKSSNLRVKRLEELIHSYNGSIKTASVEATFISINNGTGNEEILIFARAIKNSSSVFFYNNQTVSREIYLEKLKACGMNVKYPNFLVYQHDVTTIAVQDSKELRRSTDLIKLYEDLTEESKTLFNECQRLADQKKNMQLVLTKAMSTNIQYKQYLNAKNVYNDKIRLYKLICLYYLDKAIKGLTENLKCEEEKSMEFDNLLAEVNKNLFNKRKIQKEMTKEITEMDEQMHDKKLVLNQRKTLVLKVKDAAQITANKIKDCELQLENELNKFQAILANKEEVLLKIYEAKERKKHYPLRDKTSQHENQYQQLKEKAALVRGKYFKIHIKERENQADNDSIDTLQMKLKALKGFIKANEDGKTFASERLPKLREKLASFISANQKASDHVTYVEEKKGELRKTIRKLDKELIGQKEIQVNIAESRYDEMRKNVLEELKSRFAGVFDRVTNCCNVKEDKYKIALTKVVGTKHMNAIIVDNETTAINCIQYLRTKKYAPETFLPIKNIKDPIFKKVPSSSFCVVLLKDVLTYKKDYEKIMTFICKGSYVCENEDLVKLLYDQRVNVVALDGTFYQRSGLISGGAAELSKQTYRWSVESESQERQVYTNLLKELDTLKQTLARIDHQAEDPVDFDQLRAIINVTEEDIKQTERKVSNLHKVLTMQMVEAENIIRKIATLKLNMPNRDAALVDIRKEEEAIFKDFCKELGIENIAEYENMENVLFNVDKELQELDIQLKNMEELLAKNTETREYLNTQVSKLIDRRTTIGTSREELSRDLKLISNEVETLKKNTDTKLKALHTVDTDADAIKKNSVYIKLDLQKVQLARKKIQEDIIKHKNNFNREFTQCNFDGIDIPLLQDLESQESMTDYYDKIVVNYEQIPALYCAYEDTQDKKFRKLLITLGEGINNLRTQIKESDRYLMKHGKGRDEHIEAQKEKLATVEELQGDRIRRLYENKKSIADCANQRNNRLVNLVNDIKEIMRPMYAELTGGTTSNVFLDFENSDNPFLGGISFDVIVPGKSYMGLDSLSGGELTMAGILLVLAIQKFSCCPLLILDEIDAPLDHTNAVQLFKYLGKISADLQIFFISHNDNVYSEAQLLIGFTKTYGQKSKLKSKFVMLSCENYEQNSFHESEASISSHIKF